MNTKRPRQSRSQQGATEPSHAVMDTPWGVGVWIRAAVGLLVGLLLVWSGLSYAGWRQQHQWPVAVSPFVLNRVLVMHLVCSVPLVAWLGWHLATVMSGWRSAAIGGFVFLGVVLLATTVALAPLLEAVSAGSGSIACHLMRIGLSVLLLLPWGVSAGVWARQAGSVLRGMWIDGLIVVLLLSLPVIHVQELTRRETQLVQDYLVNQQYVAAFDRTDCLVRMGREKLGDQSAQDVLVGLQQQVAAFRQQLERPLPESPTAEAQIARARLLFGLGQYDQARRLLRPWSETNAEAALRYALTFEVTGDYQAAADRYKQVIDLLREEHTLTPRQQSLLRSALERRSNNLRRTNNARLAEQELLAALDDFSAIKPAVLMQLGFHYQMAGRSSEALGYFKQAAKLDSRYETELARQRKQFDSEAQGCVIRVNRGVQR